MIRNANDWQRVSKRRPCPVCGHPDWCLITGPEGAPTAAICPRVESSQRAGEAGYLHVLRPDDGPQRPRRRTVRASSEPMGERQTEIAREALLGALGTPLELLERLGVNLGLSAESLQRLGACWLPERRAWGFPMREANGRICGVRLRLPNGRKLAIKGGREGLFYPIDIEPGGRLLAAEGPTDTAALLDLGFSAVGRPSCSGGVRHVLQLVRRLEAAEAVVVADGDKPGRLGAERLTASLVAYVATVRTIRPPDGIKDARAWKAAGATHGDVQAAIEAAEPRWLAIRTTCRT